MKFKKNHRKIMKKMKNKMKNLMNLLYKKRKPWGEEYKI